mgnify:CR=1 FL=1
MKGAFEGALQTIPLALFAAMLLSGTAVAESIEDADEAYRRGDYETALRFAEPLADNGDRVAQYRLGVMYERGKGLPQDYTAAAM